MRAAVLLPAGVVLTGRAKRTFLAKAHHFDSVGRDPFTNQRIPDLIGAAFAQGEVVLVRASLVAVAFDHDLQRGVAGQKRGVAGYGLLLVAANVGIVIVEENVLHVLRE